MKGRILYATMVIAIAAAGCSKQPAEGTTYAPPPNIKPAKKGTLYMSNNSAIGMNFYIGNAFYKFIDGGTYSKKEVPPGLYAIRAEQAEDIKPGEKPRVAGLSVTVVADHTAIVSLP